MGIKQCPSCQNVSVASANCPRCGVPLHGSTSSILAGALSFFVPGLGQLLQGRFLAGLTHFVLACVLWLVILGWIVHLFSAVDAAKA